MIAGLSREDFIALAVLVCGSFVTLLNQTLITPALSTIMVEFSITTATVQWLVNGFTIVNAIMIPIAAHLIDNYSTRMLFTSAMIIFLAGSLFAAWGPSFELLLVGRMFQAAGAGILMPMCLTELMTSFPVEHRGRAMGIFGLVNAVAPVAGPTLSGIVIDSSNWHVLFYIVSGLSVAGIIAGLIALKRKDGSLKRKSHLDKLSLITCSLGLGAMLYGFSMIGTQGLSLLVIGSIVLGLLILVFFVRRQLSIKNPMLKVEILKNKRFAIAIILIAVLQPGLMCGPVLIPIYIQTTLGYSATTSGLTMIPGAIFMAILNPIVGRLFDKHGPRKLAITGAALFTVATIPMCFFNLETPLWVVAACVTLRNGMIALINMPISTWGMNALDDELMSHGSSINNCTRMVAGALGTAIIVSISTFVGTMGTNAGMESHAASAWGFDVAFMFSACISTLIMVLCIVLVKSKKAHAASADKDGKRRITLEQIMKRDVFSLPDTATVAQAAAIFVEKDVSAVPIVNAKGEAVGFVSDGDILRALSGEASNKEYIDPISLLIRSGSASGVATGFEDRLNYIMEQPLLSIAHRGIISVDVHDRLSVVCRILGENHLKKAPVLDNGVIVGIINRSDVTNFALAQYMKSHEALLTQQGVIV